VTVTLPILGISLPKLPPPCVLLFVITEPSISTVELLGAPTAPASLPALTFPTIVTFINLKMFTPFRKNPAPPRVERLPTINVRSTIIVAPPVKYAPPPLEPLGTLLSYMSLSLTCTVAPLI
jgi:hypothetical protein